MDCLMEKNIYDFQGKVLICGSCLSQMEKNIFTSFSKDYDVIVTLCLEKEHINMAITKIAGILSTGKVESLSFASVNRSPHCTQLHYIKHELERIMKLPCDIKNYILENGEAFEITDDVISLSKNLIQLSKIN